MSIVTARQFGEFVWFDLSSSDYAASAQFYGALLGWHAVDQPAPPEGDHGPYAMFELDGQPVAGLGEVPEEMVASGAPVCWNCYVQVDDLERVLAQATARGATVVVPPADVGTHGRLAYFADPQGAVVALWQTGDHGGATRVDEPGTVCWVELATRDVAAAVRFYSEVFGWEPGTPQIAPPVAGYRTMGCAGRDVAGVMGMTEEWGDMPAHWSVYFEVSSIEDAAGRVAELGGEVRHGPFQAPGVGHIAVCVDNVGAHFYLLQFEAGRGRTAKQA